MTDLRSQILTLLGGIEAPDGATDLVSAGVIRALSVQDGRVSFVIEPAGVPDPSALRDSLAARVAAVPGVTGVDALIAQAPPDLSAPTAAPAQEGPTPIDGVRHIVMVGAGKGGVGKSTVTANLALSLADMGLQVGVLDADVYGPSQPRMLGVDGRPVSYDGTLIPIAAHGIRMLSLGLMLEQDQALIWRGPILANTLEQLVHQVRWAPLDVLLIDLPPGRGDVPITLAQQVPVSGAVIVSTPQGVAQDDARRAVDLFHRMEVPMLGLVENMATHVCTHCGTEEAVFATPTLEGQDRPEEEKPMGLDRLGALPLERLVTASGDNGLPAVRAFPDSLTAQRFAEIAARVAGLLELTA